MNGFAQIRSLMRWVAVLPGAIAASFLAGMGANLIDWTISMVMGINRNGFFEHLQSDAWEGALIGATFVYVGSRIAPVQSKLISYVLTIIAIAFAIFISFRAIIIKDWWALETSIAIAVGVAVVIAYVATTDIERAHNSTHPTYPKEHTHPTVVGDAFSKWLRKRLTLKEAEAKYSIKIDALGETPIPFGYMNGQWRELVAQMKDGDELWEFRSSDESWAHMAGDEGIALMRGGDLITLITTSMN